ncbi:MAG: flagellar basal-body rod protein FlgF [Armatimonadota bacterium]
MLSGIYHAAAGMRAREHYLDLTANNLANATSPGYRRDVPTFEVNPSPPAQTAGAPPASIPYELAVRTAVDLRIGPVQMTENPFDLALDGPGFFAVQTPNGVLYTRAGNFTRDASGQLVTQDGYPVLTDNGPVQVSGSRIEVDETGRIAVDGTVVGRLVIAAFSPTAKMSKVGSMLLQASETPDTSGAGTRVLQGCLEMSNVNLVGEMVGLIRAQRAYEASQRVIQSLDDLLARASSDVGRV